VVRARAIDKSPTLQRLLNKFNTMSQEELKRLFMEWKDGISKLGCGYGE